MRRFLLFLIFISCAGNGEMAKVEISVEPDPSYIYIDENLGVKICEAKVRLEEKGGIGVYFIGERINYIDRESGEIFSSLIYNADEIREKYGHNYLPGDSWVEIKIKDMVLISGPDNFYVEDTIYCRDIKGNYFKLYYKRSCLTPLR